MPFSMKFYQDQVLAGAHERTALPAAARLLYVRHGAVTINGRRLQAHDTAYHADTLEVHGDADWSQLWRWELAQPNEPPTLLTGADMLSTLRLARVITTLELVAGEQWLFRLDRVTSVAGRVTPRHGHHGPGIRCLVQGTFNVQDAAHAISDLAPGDPWWETGVDTVVAWHSLQMPAIFMRASILPPDIKGTMSNIWKSQGPPPKAVWKLFHDELITL